MEKNIEWFLNPLKHHYFDFEGRVTRQTFWMFTLWYVIFYVIASIVSDELALVFSLAVLLPSVGLGARRLHDTGKSGWWQLIGIIPIVGWIVVIVLLAMQGTTGANEYGADPRSAAPATPGAMPAPAAAGPTAAATEAASVPQSDEARPQ